MRPLGVFHYCAGLLLLPLASSATTTTTTVSTGECSPVTWKNSDDGVARTKMAPSRPMATDSAPWESDPKTGEVNCRFKDQTYEKVTRRSCQELADEASITIEKFFMLNPEVDKDCSNLRPYTRYCTRGFLEPLRAYDGKCGPKTNATCMSSGHGDCCNSETWTCAGGMACAPGVCYEGDCWGHRIFTTDGLCGIDHGLRRCTGKWGECCNMGGQCGDGEAFCGEGNCMMGACDNHKKDGTLCGPAFDHYGQYDQQCHYGNWQHGISEFQSQHGNDRWTCPCTSVFSQTCAKLDRLGI